MAELEAVRHFARLASLVLYAAVIVRFCWSGLVHSYPAFVAYLLFELLRTSVVGFLVPYGTNLYFWFYVGTEIGGWLLYGLVVLELFGLVLRHHAGIATVGRWAVMAAVGLSVAFSALTLLLGLERGALDHQIVDDFFVMDRLAMSSLLFFLVLVTLFLLWFPIALSRNVVVHACTFAFFFLTRTLVFLSVNFFGRTVLAYSNATMHILSVICLLLWAILLTPAGEKVVIRSRRRFSPEDEQRVLAHLDSINVTLLKATGKSRTSESS
ncbi:MAG: hypothetical protein HYS04_09225 [Acidobacteria bacterium]|nr:hypothetical protein [Acidobacteriota bacterium]